jgi:hypothetical protein
VSGVGGVWEKRSMRIGARTRNVAGGSGCGSEVGSDEEGSSVLGIQSETARSQIWSRSSVGSSRRRQRGGGSL